MADGMDSIVVHAWRTFDLRYLHCPKDERWRSDDLVPSASEVLLLFYYVYLVFDTIGIEDELSFQIFNS